MGSSSFSVLSAIEVVSELGSVSASTKDIKDLCLFSRAMVFSSRGDSGIFSSSNSVISPHSTNSARVPANLTSPCRQPFS